MPEEDISILRAGGVGIVPTDTLYGIVASAQDKSAVERVYACKGRDFNKPCIVLIDSIEAIESIFNIEILEGQRVVLNRVWPGKVSAILPVDSEEYKYISRGSGGIAFRVPDSEPLREVLKKTGPLIAPSANTQGKTTATTIAEAQEYFGDLVDFYIDGGVLAGSPSELIKLTKDGDTEVLRSR